MLNAKKTTRQNIYGNRVAYSGSVTAVTPKTIVIFIPALNAEVDVRHDPRCIRPERLRCRRVSWQFGHQPNH